jgi:predicted 2-oxoglutarate/Fe(II)-dependent dioxygenase YbiX
MFNIPRFFDPATCARLLDELRAASVADATVYGAATSVDTRVRRSKQVAVSDATRTWVAQRLEEEKAAMSRHFEQALDEVEPPQFLHYTSGDFFVAHQDGNTPIIYDHTRFRKVSIVIFVSAPGDYEGGELLLHGRYPDYELRERAPAEAGTLVAFRAETTHEVTPLTGGERYTIVSWYRVRSTP